MSRPRFLTDHNLNDQIVAGALRTEPSIEILRARESGLAEWSDDAILDYAGEHQWLVVSHDVNTMTSAAIDRIGRHLPMLGLILVQQTLPVSSVIEQLVLIWSARELEEWDRLIVYLPL